VEANAGAAGEPGPGHRPPPIPGNSPAGEPLLFTIGHSTRGAEEFLALLTAHGIERLVDVRRFPGSRRHPHFGSAALAGLLAGQGIAYRHAEALGGRRDGEALASSPNTAWRHPAFRAYADYMATPAFQAALAELLKEAGERRTVIMCAEAVPWRCHRRLITDAVLARRFAVADILGPGPAVPARLSPDAVVHADGSLSYPAPPGPQAELFA
jgi:uncharacterized protein (DUF488 family)